MFLLPFYTNIRVKWFTVGLNPPINSYINFISLGFSLIWKEVACVISGCIDSMQNHIYNLMIIFPIFIYGEIQLYDYEVFNFNWIFRVKQLQVQNEKFLLTFSHITIHHQYTKMVQLWLRWTMHSVNVKISEPVENIRSFCTFSV